MSPQQTFVTGLVPVVLRLLITLAAEKRTFLPALAAGGGEGRQKETHGWPSSS